MTADLASLARGLTKAQRELASGRYDDDFASHNDAAVLERAGIWVETPPDDEDEHPRFVCTPLGLQLRAYLMEGRDG